MNELLKQIHSALGAMPGSLHPLGGGCVGQVFLARMPSGPSLVVKVAGDDGTLDIEGYMLGYLAEHKLPVPRVLHSSPNLLIMEQVPGSSRFSAAAQQHAANLLADLHAHSSETFGLERDTLIGSLHQANSPTRSWIDFFRNHRLLDMARAALGESRLRPTTFTRLERLASDLPRFLHEPPRPSLIHGDVWTTNVLASGDLITGFLDPAIYYADPEIELSFITLFDTFGDPFFRAYHARRSIAPGFFETRRHIYNLYPLLVHVRLFGSGYEAQLAATLARLGY